MLWSPRHSAALTAAALVCAFGCGQGGPKTYPVRGKVEVPGGDVKQLTGNHVEVARVGEPAVRASGEIQEDGSFTLETLHAGVILPGAQAGDYQVRIVLADEDWASQRRRRRALAGRFLQFRTSGLSLQVPAGGEVTLKVSPY